MLPESLENFPEFSVSATIFLEISLIFQIFQNFPGFSGFPWELWTQYYSTAHM